MCHGDTRKDTPALEMKKNFPYDLCPSYARIFIIGSCALVKLFFHKILLCQICVRGRAVTEIISQPKRKLIGVVGVLRFEVLGVAHVF